MCGRIGATLRKQPAVATLQRDLDPRAETNARCGAAALRHQQPPVRRIVDALDRLPIVQLETWVCPAEPFGPSSA